MVRETPLSSFICYLDTRKSGGVRVEQARMSHNGRFTLLAASIKKEPQPKHDNVGVQQHVSSNGFFSFPNRYTHWQPRLLPSHRIHGLMLKLLFRCCFSSGPSAWHFDPQELALKLGVHHKPE